MENQRNAYEHYISLPDDSQEQESYYSLCTVLMEDDIREGLHSMITATNDEFLRIYCMQHLTKFNKEFIVN
jgi:phage FluMu gp28-like protein